MNQREQLIEKARVAFVEAWHKEDDRIERWDRDDRGKGNRSRAGIRAALAVFEEANTPTGHHVDHHDDGEWEALLAEADALVESWDRRGSWSSDSPVGLVMRFAAYLRRTVQGEPTPEEWKAQIEAVRERQISKGHTPEHDAEHGIRHVLNWAIDYSRRGRAEDSSGLIYAALELLDVQGAPSAEESDLPNGHAPVEKLSPFLARRVQGEPPEAAVSAAGEVLYGISWGTDLADPDLVRAALRAAAATTSPETVYMRPFHQTYPGTTPLFHTYCSEHPAFGICGDEEQARADVAQHRAVHAATEGGERDGNA